MPNRKALGNAAFKQHRKLETASQQLVSRNVVVFVGPSGSGKTELALQLKKQCSSENCVIGWFRCDELKHVQTDVQQFARSNDFQLASSVRANHLDDLLSELFNKLNEKYTDKCKLLIFDDAEPSTDIMSHVDRAFLEPLQAGQTSKENWKIVFTTQTSFENWIPACDHLSSEDFLDVSGFDDEQIREFFNQGLENQTLSEEELAEIKDGVGCLPLMLEVLLYEMKTEGSAMVAFRKFMDGITSLGDDNKCIAALRRSIERLINQSEHKEVYIELIVLLTMFNTTNITFELLISCTEVTLDACNVDLMKRLIKDMKDRHLCDAPEPFESTSLLSFHKLIMQSMNSMKSMHLSQQEETETINCVRKALLALTRVMPRDGRAHQSHKINDYMYDHACVLVREANTLLHTNTINREKTPHIMLWMSNLQMSMAYCQHAIRSPVDRAITHIKEALNCISKLAFDKNYDELVVGNTHIHKAIELFIHITGPNCELRGNQHFKEVVCQVSQFIRLTPRDREILFDPDTEYTLCNGHLCESDIADLREQSKVLDVERLERFYAVEVLAEIYSTAARALGFHTDPQLTTRCLEYAGAAQEIYKRIRETFKVTLMAEVITEREMLKFKLRANPDPEPLAGRYRELKKTDDKAFEYGLMRADFSDDPYNDFLCDEGLAICEGRKCASLRGDETFEQTFEQVDSVFKTILARTEAEMKGHKLQMNYQTGSKAYRNYADFQWRCESYQEAVKAMLEAFIRLNYFLCGNEELSSFPELDESCGKAKFLLEFLTKFFKTYQDNSSANTERLLQRDESDEQKRGYLERLVVEWRGRGSKPADFGVMSDILDASTVQ